MIRRQVKARKVVVARDGSRTTLGMLVTMAVRTMVANANTQKAARISLPILKLVIRARDGIILGVCSMQIKITILRKPSKVRVPSTVLRIGRRVIPGKTVISCRLTIIKSTRTIKVVVVATLDNQERAAQISQEAAHLLTIRIRVIRARAAQVLDIKELVTVGLDISVQAKAITNRVTRQVFRIILRS